MRRLLPVLPAECPNLGEEIVPGGARRCLAPERAERLIDDPATPPDLRAIADEVDRDGPSQMSRVKTCLAQDDLYRQSLCSGYGFEG